MSLCHTVYVIVSHCVRHCAHTQGSLQLSSDYMEELPIVQHYVTKETNTASSSREDVKDDILILQL